MTLRWAELLLPSVSKETLAWLFRNAGTVKTVNHWDVELCIRVYGRTLGSECLPKVIQEGI